MLIRNAELGGRLRDIKVENGTIAAIQDCGTAPARPDDIDAKGGALIPGLHDHHIHLNATAAAFSSVKCGPPNVTDATELAEALNAAQGEEWIRGVGYHESVAGDINCEWLDANAPDRPIRVQHRSGRLWVFNTLALEQLRQAEPDLVTGREDGRILDQDKLLRAALPSIRPNLGPLVERLLSWGITGVTDVTPSNTVEDFQHLLSQTRPLRIQIMGVPELSQVRSEHVGAVKFHYHEDYLPPLEQLVEEFKKAHDVGRNVAAHCVTRSEIMLVLAAIEDAGVVPGDRIEHGAIMDKMIMQWAARLGVCVVTQPHFLVARKAAYLSQVPPEDHPNLWRLGSLARAGISLAAGSDAPFGVSDPWAGMAACVTRSFPGQEGSGQNGEGISPDHALAIYTKPWNDAVAPSRMIDIGAEADMCILDRRWDAACRDLSQVKVIATIIDGQCAFKRFRR